MERAKRFELSTSTLARLRSTPELRPRPSDFQQMLEAEGIIRITWRFSSVKFVLFVNLQFYGS